MRSLLGALKSRTMWFNALGLAATLLASPYISGFVSQTHLLEIQSIVNLVLRCFTTESLAAKA